MSNPNLPTPVWTAEETPDVSTRSQGSLMIDHKDRLIPGYVVSESDLEEIYHSSFLVEFGIILASSSIGFGVGLWKDVAISPDTPETVTSELGIIYWLCAIGFVAGTALALWQISRRHRKVLEFKGMRSYWDRLKLRHWIEEKFFSAN